MDKDRLVDSLNDDLALELRSIVQYVQHIATVKGPEYQQTLKELSHHVNQELEHALILARQIDFLGGQPTTDLARVQLDIGDLPPLEQDLELERRQLERYRERVEQADEAGLPDVSEALAPILSQTQDHIRELEAALTDGRAQHA